MLLKCYRNLGNWHKQGYSGVKWGVERVKISQFLEKNEYFELEICNYTLNQSRKLNFKQIIRKPGLYILSWESHYSQMILKIWPLNRFSVSSFYWLNNVQKNQRLPLSREYGYFELNIYVTIYTLNHIRKVHGQLHTCM